LKYIKMMKNVKIMKKVMMIMKKKWNNQLKVKEVTKENDKEKTLKRRKVVGESCKGHPKKKEQVNYKSVVCPHMHPCIYVMHLCWNECSCMWSFIRRIHVICNHFLNNYEPYLQLFSLCAICVIAILWF